MTRAERIRQLVAELDQEDATHAEEAQSELTQDFGAEALEPLLEAAPAFSDFGRLCAIEVFEAIGDPRAGPVLIPWLKSDDDTVRDWSAGALGRLGVGEAVPALRAAWEASKDRATPPDWTEPVSIRHALAALGAREVVVPEVVARLRVEDDRLGSAWPAQALSDVLNALADARQVVPYFMYSTRRPEYDPKRWYGVTGAGASIELDWSQPWDTLVEEARRQAVGHAEAQAAGLPPGTVATVEWLDESDVQREGVR
jgi:HEAT repeats